LEEMPNLLAYAVEMASMDALAPKGRVTFKLTPFCRHRPEVRAQRKGECLCAAKNVTISLSADESAPQS